MQVVILAQVIGKPLKVILPLTMAGVKADTGHLYSIVILIHVDASNRG